MAEGRPLRLFGDAQSRRDYVHVDDVVAAMVGLVHRRDRLPTGGDPLVLNVGSGVPTPLETVLSEIAGVVGRPLRIEQQGARGFDRRDTWLDVERAARLLGWRAEIGLDTGIASTWDLHVRALHTAHRRSG